MNTNQQSQYVLTWLASPLQCCSSTVLSSPWKHFSFATFCNCFYLSWWPKLMGNSMTLTSLTEESQTSYCHRDKNQLTATTKRKNKWTYMKNIRDVKDLIKDQTRTNIKKFAASGTYNKWIALAVGDQKGSICNSMVTHRTSPHLLGKNRTVELLVHHNELAWPPTGQGYYRFSGGSFKSPWVLLLVSWVYGIRS